MYKYSQNTECDALRKIEPGSLHSVMAKRRKIQTRFLRDVSLDK